MFTNLISRRGFLGGAGILGMGAALSTCLAACGSGDGSGSAETTSDGLTKVTLGTVPWPSNEFFYLAKEKGIYKDNGLDVDVQIFSSTTDSSNAFVSGNLDFCTYASSETIVPYINKAPISIVLEIDKSNGCEGIVAKPEVKSVLDLKGKTIATQLNSVDHMLLLTLLNDNGLSSDDVNIVDMSIENAGNAFIAGQCDAASIWDPYFSQAKDAGGTVLYSTADNPDLITDVLGANSNLCKNSPDAVKGFVKSYFDAIAYWQENPDESEKIMADHMGTSVEDWESQIKGLKLPTAADCVTAFTPADDTSYWGYVQNQVMGFLVELGQIDDPGDDADCGDMIDDTFVKELAEED